ncbi:spermidine synthase [Bacillus sp. V5-8f]|uniref:spermine/spermidine synthase domain-containing protein n=1 Tax=Bacillus sp. V5-8f TaxID=2053044 RepID=UPI000C757160|nr:spermidine synthase [Bacillus sp. V5-8f]PLT33165.1 spermidine synthase [Bacillus sp. V5-8f]
MSSENNLGECEQEPGKKPTSQATKKLNRKNIRETIRKSLRSSIIKSFGRPPESRRKLRYKVEQRQEVKQPDKKVRGDEWDRISLREMLAGNSTKLFQGQSRYQNIQIVEAKDIRLFLDEQLQFSSLDERIYHEAFVHVPMALRNSHDHILIVGGGDGLALREVLKYSDVKSVDLVDIDPEILNIARNLPEIVALNERALFDERVQAHANDAREFLRKNTKVYDLIIVDFPDPADEELAGLYTLEMFQMLGNHLADDGMIACQAISPLYTPIVFWSIGLTLQAAGFYTEGYHTIVPSFGDWGFQLGSKKPLPTELKKSPDGCRTLPADLASLFHFQSEILYFKRAAIVNKSEKVLLHDIYQYEII